MGLINFLRKKKPSADSEHIQQMEHEYHAKKSRERKDIKLLKRIESKRNRIKAIREHEERMRKRERIKKIVFENYYKQHHRTWDNHKYKPKRNRKSKPQDYDYNVFSMPKPGTYEKPFNPFEPMRFRGGNHKRNKR